MEQKHAKDTNDHDPISHLRLVTTKNPKFTKLARQSAAAKVRRTGILVALSRSPRNTPNTRKGFLISARLIPMLSVEC